MLNRRDFLDGAMASALMLSTSVNRIEASAQDDPFGVGPAPLTGALNLNASAAWANLAKAFVWIPDNTPQDLKGYPTTLPTKPWHANAGVETPPNYAGRLVWKWNGTATMQLSPAFVIYSGSRYINGRATDGAFNMTINGASGRGATNPEVHFAFGYNIQNLAQSPVSNGHGGKLIRVTVKKNYFINGSDNQQLVIGGQTGQANAIGTWLITKVDSSVFDLQGSTWNAADPYVGPSGQAIYINLSFLAILGNMGVYSEFSELIFCTESNLHLVNAGGLVDPTYKAQVQHLRPAWLRFMDLIGVQASVENSINYRMPVHALSYQPDRRIPAYQATSGAAGTPGVITSGANDAYTCPNPAASGSDVYVDGEIVQGNIDKTNTGYNPTLNVGGRGPKPIGSGNINIWFTGAKPSTGTVISFTVSASWLNGGTPYDFTYTVQSSDTSLSDISTGIYNKAIADIVLGDASGNGLGRITGGISWRNGGTVLTAYPRSAQAGRLTIMNTRSIPGLTVNVGSMDIGQFVAQYATLRYSKLTDSWEYFREWAFSIPYEYFTELANAARAGVWYTMPIETTAQYASDVAAYFAQNLTSGLPYAMEVGNEMWNFGLALWGRAVVYGCAMGMYPNSANLPIWSYTGNRFVQYIQAGRTGWTGAGGPSDKCYGCLIGWVAETGVGQNFDTYALAGSKLVTSNSAYNSYGGLGATAGTSYNASGSRPVDNADASGIAYYWGSPWWAGSANDINPVAGAVGQNAPWLQASKDYANGSTSTAFASLVGQFTRTVGIASFTASASGTTLTINGLTGTIMANGTEFVSPVTPNAAVPKINYKINSGSGSTFTMQDPATFSNVLCTTAINLDYIKGDLRSLSESAANMELMLAQYSRPGPRTGVLGVFAYESAPQFGLGGNLNAGTNGTASSDISPLVTQMTNLDWNVSPYTVSGTDNKTEAATQVIQMMQGWKFDTHKNGATAGTNSYKDMIKTYFYAAQRNASPTRVVVPSQYGYAGSNWGYFPQRITDTPYKSYDAAVEDGNGI
jgi:hypothetical protein